MQYENLIYELEDAAQDLLVLSKKAKAGILSETEYEIGIKHVLKHIIRGYNRRNLPSAKSWGTSEKEYKNLLKFPSNLLKDLM